MSPVPFSRCHGFETRPHIEGVPDDQVSGDDHINGSLFTGEKSMLTTGCRGANKSRERASLRKAWRLPHPLTRAGQVLAKPGWGRNRRLVGRGACLLELLGGRASRAMDPAGDHLQELRRQAEGDAERGRIADSSETNQFVRLRLRKAWKFSLAARCARLPAGHSTRLESLAL